MVDVRQCPRLVTDDGSALQALAAHACGGLEGRLVHPGGLEDIALEQVRHGAAGLLLQQHPDDDVAGVGVQEVGAGLEGPGQRVHRVDDLLVAVVRTQRREEGSGNVKRFTTLVVMKAAKVTLDVPT